VSLANIPLLNLSMPKLLSTVSTWLQRLKREPDELSAQKLWDRVSPRIELLSRELIQRFGSDAAFDEEDVMVSVFASLYTGLSKQKFPNLHDSDGLWKLLTLITVRKINDRTKQRRALKRLGECTNDGSANILLDSYPDRQPEPSIDAMMADECRMMLNQLNDPMLEKIVLLRLDGYSNDEIAQQLNYSRRTIQRMLNLVKDAWSHYVVE
jgi:DNA-directed RNA polymerase specialized sigma24 family protein